MTAGALNEADRDIRFAKEALERVASDLQMIVDREVFVTDLQCARESQRPAGEGSIHISFRQAYVAGPRTLHGCILFPLSEALTLAGYLMLEPEEVIETMRACTELDDTVKDAILELGNFIAAAVDGVVRDESGGAVSVRPEGCQGVRADVRPAFPYDEGSPLMVCRASGQVHTFPRFELLQIAPPLDGFRTD